MPLAMDLGKYAGTKVSSNLLEIPNSTFTAVICSVSNDTDNISYLYQLQAPYMYKKSWKDLIDFTNNTDYPKLPYIVTSKFQCNLENQKAD
jgi:hypothetical protein